MIIKNYSTKIKVIFNSIFIILLIISYIFNISDSFALGKIFINIFIEKKIDSIQIVFGLISAFILFMNIYCLLSYSLKKSIEMKLFLIFSFITFYIIIIGPGLNTSRIHDHDAMLHLYFVKLINSSSEFPYYYHYTNFFFQRFLAFVSRITKINPHSLFLFFPQFIMYFLYCMGVLLILRLLTDKNSISYQKYIYLITICNPFLISVFAGVKPISFLISIFPLIIYLSIKTTKKNFIILSILLFICVGSHVYGYFILVMTVWFLILKLIVIKYFKKENNLKIISYLKVLLFLICLIPFLFPSLIYNLFNFLSIKNEILEIFVNGFFSGSFIKKYGVFQHENFLSFLYYSHNIIGMLIFCYIVPFFVVFLNQLSYYYIKKGKTILFDNKMQLRFFCDYYFIFILISLFFGASIDFWRFSWMACSIYFIVFIYFWLIFLKEQKMIFSNIKNQFFLRTFTKLKDRILKIKNKLIRKVLAIEFKNKIEALCLIIVLLFSFLNFSFFSVLPYTDEQYNASEWINVNTPSDSIFLLHPYFENFIKGMTLRDTTENCTKLFDLNLNISERSKSFFLMNNSDYRFINHSKGFLSLDINYINRLNMEILWIGEPCVGNGEECVSLNVLYNELNNSNLFKLIYNQTNILIYEIEII